MQINISIKNVIIFIFLINFLISCQGEREKLTISGLSGKYWDVYKMNRRKEYKMTDYGYYFKSNGECIYYFYSKSSTKIFERNKFDFGDIIYPEKWSFKNDSIVNIMGISYNVLQLSENETIIVNILNRQDTVHLRLSTVNVKNSTWR